MEVVDSERAEGCADFGEVRCYLGWWDCPRFGLTIVENMTQFFDCRFSDELNDYPDEFGIWPALEGELADFLTVWGEQASWKCRFEAGKEVGDFTPRPEAKARFNDALDRLHQRAHEPVPVTARNAIPEWKLDPNRSFFNRQPTHHVRWHWID
jgi:hypothetical protein